MFIELDFPREILEMGSQTGRAGRFLVRDWDELERYWKGKNGSGNAYFTAYGYRATKAPRNHRVDYDTPIIRHFIMDFDCKDFKKRGQDVDFSYMHEQVKRLHEYLLSEDYRHFIWFSGGGFHIWIPLSETFIPSSTTDIRRIKDAGRKLLAEWDSKTKVSMGKKYVKVVQDTGVFAFIVKEDFKHFKKGDILKPAGWNAPALNSARGNVLTGNYNIQWTGPLYLK